MAIAFTIPPKTNGRVSPTKKSGTFANGRSRTSSASVACIRKIIQFDLDLIENKADYVVCHLDDSAKVGVLSGGTPAELTFAYRKGIPVYLVTALAPDQISGWMLACADRVFDSVDTLKKFLLERYGAQRQTQLWKE